MYAPSSLPRKTALAGLVALLASRAEAFWRLPCSSPVVVERSDPIMDPGVVSKHAHTVMGSNAFNFTMDYALTQTATCTTCKVKQDLSSYWVPNLYYHAENGSFVPVQQAGGALIYYLQRQDEKDPEYEKGLLAFPEDFRMIAGNPDNRNASDSLEQKAVSFVCLGVDGPATPTLPTRNCPNGLRTQLVFPSCWDGQNLDADDHKSHMAYPSRVDSGACPASHPKRFITIFYEVTWNVDAFKDAWPGAGRDQPFVFSNGDPTGYGFHGDFLNGWDVPTLQKAVDECTASSGVVEECGAFEFHTDDAMNSCRQAPRVAETVTGPAAAGGLPALPGCNPVQAGPEPAVRGDAARCAAPGGNGTSAPDTRLAVGIGAPALPFTDAAPSKRWRYVGCLKDGGAFPTRTLDGPSQDDAAMTVDRCLDFCAARGFAYAGLEYKTQCFCGRAPAAGRAQPAGTLGECDMPCAGDAGQICGGYGQESVYQKCEGTGVCQNAKLDD